MYKYTSYDVGGRGAFFSVHMMKHDVEQHCVPVLFFVDGRPKKRCKAIQYLHGQQWVNSYKVAQLGAAPTTMRLLQDEARVLAANNAKYCILLVLIYRVLSYIYDT